MLPAQGQQKGANVAAADRSSTHFDDCKIFS